MTRKLHLLKYCIKNQVTRRMKNDIYCLLLFQDGSYGRDRIWSKHHNCKRFLANVLVIYVNGAFLWLFMFIATAFSLELYAIIIVYYGYNGFWRRVSFDVDWIMYSLKARPTFPVNFMLMVYSANSCLLSINTFHFFVNLCIILLQCK